MMGRRDPDNAEAKENPIDHDARFVEAAAVVMEGQHEKGAGNQSKNQFL
jgi:hypothetical protein